MYRQVRIEGFRAISALEIDDLRQVNLLVGDNGCGKSSVLEALSLLSDPTSPQGPLRLGAGDGAADAGEDFWRQYFHRLKAGEVVITGMLEPGAEKRRLAITPTANGLRLSLLVQKGRNKAIALDTTVLRGEGSPEVQAPRHDHGLLRVTLINDRTMAAHLPWAVAELKRLNRLAKVVKILQRIEPALRGLAVRANGSVSCNIGLEAEVPISGLGGLSRLLAVLSGVATCDSGIVLLDDVANGLDRNAHATLWEAIFRLAGEYAVQVVASTLSWENVAHFDAAYERAARRRPELRLFRIERRRHDFRVVNYDHPTLRVSLERQWEVR